MKNINLISRFRSLNLIAMVLVLLASPLASAYAACCAGHGGVASCNKTTGHKMCKDGTASPSCTCPISKKAAKKKVAPKTTTTTTTTKSKKTPVTTKSTTTTTKTKNSWWGGASTTAPANTSAKGCCSRHGGVAEQCNRSTGYHMCKDGTPSPTCRCR